ncbi:prenyltransferase [uncultured Sphaerochaeta sp.]|uniref:prenyltransferase n=1 Tax=uncultured Sphaerochaeta sp. TaxID=886478 RepID=UPI002A0A3708|nr:prenyltransferase [uncultured Sphaerochaeta sp.]
MNIKQFNNIVEVRTKLVSLVTFLSGSLYAFYRTGTWSWKIGLPMMFAVLFVDMGTTGFNTYFDYVNGTDTKEDNKEQDKVLVHDGVKPFQALLISLGLFMMAGILGLVLAFLTSWKLIPLGFICMVVGFSYTGGPFPISRTPLGELFAGGFLGTALFLLSFYVQTLFFDSEAFLSSLPFFFMVALILSVNNTCDMDADRKAGRRTLSIVLTERKASVLLYGELIAAHLLGIVLVMVKVYPLWLVVTTLFSVGFSLWQLLFLQKSGFSAKTKSSSMQVVSSMYGLFGVCFLFGLTLSLLC